MSAKSTSPEAAQRKVWKAEIQDHRKALAKVCKDFDAEERRLGRELTKAMKARIDAAQKLDRYQQSRAKKEPRAVAAINRRIAILERRMGI
jgi:hypothetical protein